MRIHRQERHVDGVMLEVALRDGEELGAWTGDELDIPDLGRRRILRIGRIDSPTVCLQRGEHVVAVLVEGH